MTLYQISFTYRADAAVLRTRISELRAAARAAQDREEAERLKRRIAELQVLRRQSSSDILCDNLIPCTARNIRSAIRSRSAIFASVVEPIWVSS